MTNEYMLYRFILSDVKSQYVYLDVMWASRFIIYSHLDYFLDSLGVLPDEEGVWFHHDIKTMEER